MDYYRIIADNFQDTIETISLSVDTLAGPLEQACQVMTRALLEDRKIVACGAGADAALAQLFSSSLLGRFERERPALPAMALGADAASLTAIAVADGLGDIFSRQLRALGQPGDVLLGISSGVDSGCLRRAIIVARDRNMGLVLLSNESDSELSTEVAGDGVALRVRAHQPARVVEMHTMLLNCLCELIDQSLFGSYDRE